VSVEIIALTELADMYDAVELQKDYWGGNIESVVPSHMLFTIVKTGGHVLAGYDSGRMVGVLISVLATTSNHNTPVKLDSLAIYSKRMVVLPEYRGRGIGNDLKWAQRDIAIQQGIEKVIWTYDPLLSRNAHLNIRKLGCVCTTYHVDYFGSDQATGLATGGASDRFGVIWHVNDPDVVRRSDNTFIPMTLEGYLDNGARVVNLAKHEGGFVFPDENGELPFSGASGCYLVEIPLQFPELLARDSHLGSRWIRHVRTIFSENEFGFKVVDFVRGHYDGHERGFYLVEYPSMLG